MDDLPVKELMVSQLADLMIQLLIIWHPGRRLEKSGVFIYRYIKYDKICVAAKCCCKL